MNGGEVGDLEKLVQELNTLRGEISKAIKHALDIRDGVHKKRKKIRVELEDMLSALLDAELLVLHAQKLCEKAIKKMTVVVIRHVSKEQAKKEITEFMRRRKVAYPSDVANELGLDLDLTFDVFGELEREGVIRVCGDGDNVSVGLNTLSEVDDE